MAGSPVKRARRAKAQRGPLQYDLRGTRPSSDSRARASTPEQRVISSPAPESVAGRIAEIAEWMRQLWWETGRSVRLFAEAWGIPESTVRNYSAEAHRLVMSEVDAETCSRETGLALRRVLHDAQRDGDRHSVIRASEVWATLSGAKAAEKYQEIPPDAATPAKARKVMRDLFGDVTPAAETGADGGEDDAQRDGDEDEGEPSEGSAGT